MAENHIARLIYELRTRRGMTQEVLAEEAGLSVGVVKKLEAGGSARMDSYEAIAAALDARLTLQEQRAVLEGEEQRLADTMGRIFARAESRRDGQAGAQSDGQQSESADALKQLEARIQGARRRQASKPLLMLIGGYAGSGKSEFGKAIARVTGWTVIDKDVTARPMTEQLLTALGADPNDRHSPVYLEHVRPLEYLCTLDAACRNLECGHSTILTAPFLCEMASEAWTARLIHRCASLGCETAFVWLDCDLPTMREQIQRRGAARDAWKLSHWGDYECSVDLNMRPCVPHIVVDNRCNAAISLADQAAEIAARITPN